LIGVRRVAVIDPGPDDATHLASVAEQTRGADSIAILLTHGHADPAAGASALARVLGAEVYGPAGVGSVTSPLSDGDAVRTDHGDLAVVDTPGHSRDHFAYHLPRHRALFAGDLLIGKGDTVWVGEYPGCVADYLASLRRLGRLDLDVVYPAHGPQLERPYEALDRFAAHRRERIRQMAEALATQPDARLEELLEIVYGGDLSEEARGAAIRSIEALKVHVEWARA